jgi:hypothetical protein
MNHSAMSPVTYGVGHLRRSGGPGSYADIRRTGIILQHEDFLMSDQK